MNYAATLSCAALILTMLGGAASEFFTEVSIRVFIGVCIRVFISKLAPNLPLAATPPSPSHLHSVNLPQSFITTGGHHRDGEVTKHPYHESITHFIGRAPSRRRSQHPSHCPNHIPSVVRDDHRCSRISSTRRWLQILDSSTHPLYGSYSTKIW